MESIWMKQPALQWEQALPVGNGNLGAMIYGGDRVERMDFNADTFWAGFPHDKVTHVGKEWLPSARSVLREGDYLEAEKIVHQYMQGEEVDGYQPVGTLYIDYQIPDKGAYGFRKLDLKSGIHQTQFSAMGRTYYTETFASFAHDVIAIQVTIDQPAYISVRMAGHYVKEREQQDGMLVVRGQAPEISNQLAYRYPERKLHEQGDRGVWYEAAVAAASDGNDKEGCEELWFEQATSLFLCIAISTSYDGMNRKPCRAFRGKAVQTAQRGLKLGYESMKKEHISWFSGHMGKLQLQLQETDNAQLPTDERLKRVQAGENDPAFAALYMQFGRYLLLSSSAKGMPANLQGIWNGEEKARWNSNYTLNINLPMNYWLAEIGNLDFCHKPLFSFLEQAQENGKKAAQAYFGCRGFFLAHNSDLWGSANPVNGYPRCIAWTTGGAWLCRHIWEHYLYSGNKEELAEYFPVIQQAVRFTLDYLADDGEGHWSYYPSSSPENEYFWQGEKIAVTKGSTMELSIVRELLTIFLKAGKELHIPSGAIQQEAEQALQKLRPLAVGSGGRLLEWSCEVQEVQEGHRHMSHLYGLYPAWEWEDRMDLRAAAKQSLDYRMAHGGGYTGWSAAWSICLYARLQEGEAAYHCLQKLWNNSTLSNLFDTCNGVFQIDGNLGAPAGILEMLAQSHRNRIELLPALPKEWHTGKVKGLCLRGGGELEMAWQNGKLTKFQIHGGNSLPVYYQGKQLV